MSQLKVDTISTRAGRAQDSMLGQAKAWSQIVMGGGSVPGLTSGFNVASLTDNGVGVTRNNFITAMASTAYVGHVTSSATTDAVISKGGTKATTSFVSTTYYASSLAAAATNNDYNPDMSVFGALA